MQPGSMAYSKADRSLSNHLSRTSSLLVLGAQLLAWRGLQHSKSAIGQQANTPRVLTRCIPSGKMILATASVHRGLRVLVSQSVGLQARFDTCQKCCVSPWPRGTCVTFRFFGRAFGLPRPKVSHSTIACPRDQRPPRRYP